MLKQKSDPIPSLQKLSIPYTSPLDYPKLISDANQKYRLGIPAINIEKLDESLKAYPHLDDQTPTSVRMWLRGSLKNNWEKMFSWLSGSLEAEGINITSCIHPAELRYYDPAKDAKFFSCIKGKNDNVKFAPKQVHKYECNKLVLSPVRLNLGGYLVPDTLATGYWGGLEVLPFLALNPQLVGYLDGIIIRYLCANGLRAQSGLVPVISYDDDNAQCDITGHLINPDMNFDREAASFPWEKVTVFSVS